MFAKREKPLTKSDLVEYIGPIFQDLKSGLTEKIDSVELRLTDKINSVDNKLTDKINWQGTLMEEMNKKIDVALEFTERTTLNDIAIKEHSTKIENLETDVGLIKLNLKMPAN